MFESFSLDERQYNLLMIKLNEISESNVLVAATNIAQDEGITLEESVTKALNLMDRIRKQKQQRRYEPEDLAGILR